MTEDKEDAIEQVNDLLNNTAYIYWQYSKISMPNALLFRMDELCDITRYSNITKKGRLK